LKTHFYSPDIKYRDRASFCLQVQPFDITRALERLIDRRWW